MPRRQARKELPPSTASGALPSPGCAEARGGSGGGGNGGANWLSGLAAGWPNSSSPADWGMDSRPPGGFFSYFQNPASLPYPQQNPPWPAMSQNSHFNGATSYYTPFPPQPSVNDSPPVPDLRSKSPNNVDNIDDVTEAKTDKRLTWTLKEDERLMNAWLEKSNDAVGGNLRKSDHYWGDVTVLYNSTTPADRRRSLRQAKEHWCKLNKWCSDFNNSWIKAERIYASGQSDDQLTAKAQKFYDEDYGGVFLQISCWKVVRYQPKWLTYNDELKNPRKRNLGDVGEVGDYISSHIDIEDIPRPKGTKAAKAERSGSGKSKKGKGNLPTADNEELDKYAEAYKNRSKVLELQKRISGEKLESAKLIHLASKEKKEAKALEQYTKLVTHDTTKMSDDAKAEHMMAIKFMREQLQKASATTMD